MLVAACLYFQTVGAQSSSLLSNVELPGIVFKNPPEWLKKSDLISIIDGIKTRTGWNPENVVVQFYNDPGLYGLALQDARLGGTPAWGFADSSKNMIHIGPQTRARDFKLLFSHELGHLISWSLFHGSMADYLEEGFAEWVAQNPNLSFSWINQQNKTIDPRLIMDAMRQGGASFDIQYRYGLSYATVLFLANKCPDLIGVLRDSGGQNLDKLLADRCQTPFFLNSFQLWLNEMAFGSGRPRY